MTGRAERQDMQERLRVHPAHVWTVRCRRESILYAVYGDFARDSH